MTLNEITYMVRGAAFAVYNELGPGLLEKVYQEAMAYQLAKVGLTPQREVAVPIIYDGHVLASDLKIDILVNNEVVVELKSVSDLTDVHKKQLQTYLKLTGKKVGLLINFNVDTLDSNAIIRCVNGYQDVV